MEASNYNNKFHKLQHSILYMKCLPKCLKVLNSFNYGHIYKYLNEMTVVQQSKEK